MLGARDAMTALAGGFNRHVQRGEGHPRIDATKRAGIVARTASDRGVRSPAGGFDFRLRHAPLRPRDFETWLEVKRREREHFKIPRARRPLVYLAMEIC